MSIPTGLVDVSSTSGDWDLAFSGLLDKIGGGQFSDVPVLSFCSEVLSGGSVEAVMESGTLVAT
jgi:hypothetical protein